MNQTPNDPDDSRIGEPREREFQKIAQEIAQDEDLEQVEDEKKRDEQDEGN